MFRTGRRVTRRMGPRVLLVGTVLVGTPFAAVAQSLPHPDSVSLGAVLASVQRSHPRIAAARARAEAAHARIAPTTRLPDPQLQLGAMNYTLPRLAPMPTVGMIQLQLMQMLPLGGKRKLDAAIATARAEADDARARDATWEVRARTVMTFLALWRADQQLTLARESVRLMQELARSAEVRYSAGEGRQSDVLRAQVEVARMREDTLRMLAMRQSAEAQLLALLDRPATDHVGAAQWPALPSVVPSRAQLESLADQQRPMVRAGELEVRAARASATRTDRERFPDLQVGLQLGRARMPADLAGMRQAETMGSLMIGASLPVYSTSRQRPMRDEARAMARMAQAELDAMRVETRARVGEVHAMLERAQRLAALYRASILPQADAAAQSSLGAYRAGGAEFMAALENRLALVRYRQELVALDAEQGEAWAELEMLTATAWVDTPPSSSREPR